MSEGSETPTSPASDGDVALERDHLTETMPGATEDVSRLPSAEAAPALFSGPRLARVTRRLGSDERARRRVGWSRNVGALVAAALVVTLFGYVLIHLAPSRANLGDSPTVTPSLTALTTATTTAAATTAALASTVTATAASAGPGTSHNGGGVNQPAGPVYVQLYSVGATSGGSQADSSPSSPAQSGVAFSTRACGPTFAVNTTFIIGLTVSAPNIAYYVRHSDGTSDGSVAQPLVLPANPANTPGVWVNNSWSFPYTLATGEPQWLELDILAPDPFTVRVDFTALCTFEPMNPSIAVSPTTYNCAAGGNQSFTFTGAILASYAVGSHTLTYHWRRYDGSVTPDQTLTFAQGVTSLPAQPDIMVVNSSVFPTAPVDELVVNYQPGDARGVLLSPSICFPTATPVVPTATPATPTATPSS